MALTPVTDENLIRQLESGDVQQPAKKNLRLVTDENLLNQLEEKPKKEPESYAKSLGMAPFRVTKDIGDMIYDRLSKIPDYLEAAKTELPGVVDLIKNDKMALAKQGAAGLAEQGTKLMNARPDFYNYMVDRLHLLPEIAKNAYPRTRDIEPQVNELFGKPVKPGEALVRGVGRNSLGIIGALDFLGAAAPYANPMNIPRALKSTRGIKAELRGAEGELNAAQEAENVEKGLSKDEHNTGDIHSLRNKKKLANEKLNDLYEQLNANPPRTAAEQENANQLIQKYTQEHNAAKTALQQAQAASVREINLADENKIVNKINTQQKKLDQLIADQKAGKPVTQEQLDKANADLEAAQGAFEENKNYAESNFGTSGGNALQKKINDNTSKITELQEKLDTQKEVGNAPNLNEYAENEKRAGAYHENAQNIVAKAENEIAKHVNEGAAHEVRASRAMKHEITSINDYWSDAYDALTKKLKSSKFQLSNHMPDIEEFFIGTENPELIELLKKSPTVKDVKASDFMTKQKEFRNARYDLLQRAKFESSPVKRKELFEAYDKSLPVQNIINKTLEEGLGEHLPEYRRVNEGYSTQVFPLKENDVANKIMRGEKLSKDIAQELAGDEEGQALLRDIASRNPEIKRNIMGQQYKKGGKDKSGFYNPDETVREYLNTMPELNRLIDARENAIRYADEAKSNFERSKSLHNEAKEHQSNIEKEQAKIAEQRAIDEKKIKDLQEKNTLLGGIKQKLAETAENKTKLEAYNKELKELKTHQDNTQASINDITENLKVLNKHVESIQSTKARLESMKAPEKAAKAKEVDVNKIEREANKINEKLKKLDENIALLEKAKAETKLKLDKKLEVEKRLQDAKEMRKEARRRLKVAGAATAVISAGKIVPSVKDYLLNRKSD